MNKNYVIFMSVICLFMLCGCGTEDEKDSKKTTTTTSSTTISTTITTSKKQIFTTTKKKTTTTTKKKTTTTKKKTTTTSCKKFSKTYSYFYDTKEACNKNIDRVFLDVSDNIDDSIFTAGCEMIVDNCGDTYYGMYFNVWDSEKSEVVRRYY